MNKPKLVRRVGMLAVLLFLAVPFLAGASPALAAGTTRWVNVNDPNGGGYAPPGTSCNDPGYPTIQSAVTASNPGDTITVCPGVYPEIVVIPVGKDNLTLRSVTALAAVIQAPPTIAVDVANYKSIVRVAGAKNTTIQAFTINGPGPGPCDSIEYGVRVDTNGSANIQFNHITEIRDTPFSGCQNGIAVQVGRLSELQVGTATITGNTIDKYQKGGIVVANTGSSAQIRFNRVQGAGPTAVTAQNGVQVSDGATATAQANAVSDNVYTPPTFSATGILLYDAGVVDVSYNFLTRNDVGVYEYLGKGATIGYNQVSASTFDGITLDTTNGNTVRNNRSNSNSGGGIALYSTSSAASSSGNTVRDNETNSNAQDGILLDADTNHNMVTGNNSQSNSRDGMRAETTSNNNIIRSNVMQKNVEHDCHDNSSGPYNPPALVANQWINDQGNTQNKPGLCDKADRRDDDHEKDGEHGHPKPRRTDD